MKRFISVFSFFVIFLTMSSASLSLAKEKKTPKAILSLPLLFPLNEAAYSFNNNSRYLSSVQYGLVFSSLFSEEFRKVLGRWSLKTGLSWTHRFFSLKSADEKIFPSYYPSLLSVSVQWDLNYFPYVTPGFSAGQVFQGPFKGNYSPIDPAFSNQKRLYLLSFSLFLSFDILESHFSKTMYYEYNIHDMGLFLEYQMYGSMNIVGQKSGWAFGFFTSV